MSSRPAKRSKRTPQVGDGKTKSLRLAAHGQGGQLRHEQPEPKCWA
jgi:hypothetical protein